MGMLAIYKWGLTGTLVLILLLGPIAMDSPQLPSHEPDHWQPKSSPINDLWKVNLPYPHTHGKKLQR